MSANGRFISNTLGRSKKFNRLPDHFTKLVYMHAITHADAEGRTEADAVDWYANDFVLDEEASIDRVEAAIRKLGEVGLIQLYTVDGKRYAAFVDFHKHNKIRRFKSGEKEGLPEREAASKIPPPPTDRAGSAQEPRSGRAVSQHEVEVEVEVEVQEEVEVEGSSEDRFQQLVTTGHSEHAETARVRTALRRTAGKHFANKHEDDLAAWARWSTDDIKRMWEQAKPDTWAGNAAAKPRAFLFEDLLNETRTPPGFQQAGEQPHSALIRKYRGVQGVKDGKQFEVVGTDLNGQLLMTDVAGYLTPDQVEEAHQCLPN